ncbi:DNA-3-methyladenine glycosylase family protein [Afipia sp. P52-10]|uniref:DNA-3-methyladenine glycosylase family protein n=1 Tax=Afipia sp. P52-10 TaxID=1429916 RepID=UPI0004B8E1F5
MQDGLHNNPNRTSQQPSAMPFHLETQADLDRALQALRSQDRRLDPIFEMVLQAAGPPALRRRAPGFAGLASTICGQQLSTFAAAAIWARMVEAYDELHHDHIRQARADKLRRLGLSVAKIKTLKFIAGEIAAGRLDLAALADAPADAAHAALTKLHGIGPWTADIYLLFCLGHGDAWPAGDLAIQEAVRIGLGLRARPTVKEMATLGEAWRPYRGAAAHLFWSYYKVVKASGFDPMPPEKKVRPAAPAKATTKARTAAKTRKPSSAATRKPAKFATSQKPRKGAARHGR